MLFKCKVLQLILCKLIYTQLNVLVEKFNYCLNGDLPTGRQV